MKPMTQLRKTWLTLMMSGALLTGCALPERQLTPDATATSQHWSGRMALQVQDSQQQSFSAGFELQGRPENGTLLVFKRSENSWHGHEPFEGKRRAIQMNWVTDNAVVEHEQRRHRVTAFLKKINPFGNRATADAY